jgi:hypothetical protein
MGQGDAPQRNGERIRNEENIGFCPALDPIELQNLERLWGIKSDRTQIIFDD